MTERKANRATLCDLLLLSRLAGAGDADAAEALSYADPWLKPILNAVIEEVADELRRVTNAADLAAEDPRKLLAEAAVTFDELGDASTDPSLPEPETVTLWGRICRQALHLLDTPFPAEGMHEIANHADAWEELALARHWSGRILDRHPDWFADDAAWYHELAEWTRGLDNGESLLPDASPRVRGLWSGGPLADGPPEEHAADLIDLARELDLGDFERPPADRTRADEIHRGRAKLRPPLVQVHTVLPARTINGLYHNDAILMSGFIPDYDLPQGWSAAMLPEARRALEDFVEQRPDLFGRPTPLRVDDADLKERLWAVDRRRRAMTLRTRPETGGATLELLGDHEDAEAQVALGELRALREAVAVEPLRLLAVCGTDDAGRATEAALLTSGDGPRAVLADLDPPRPGSCVTPDELRKAAGRVPHLADLLATLDLLPTGARVAVHVAARPTATVLTGRRCDWEPRREGAR
jgi:hypothetical protein